MPNKKDSNLLEKIVKKNYKNELEEVLEKKYFGENAKSLLLEILYKIEAAYKDYETIKKDTKTKEEYIENFIQIIKEKCKNIKIVKPNSVESKILDNKTFLVNKSKGEIICLPIARKMLYAVAKIGKREVIVNKKYSILSKTMSNMINVGDNINMVEPLRDFNGWSWTTVNREYESIEYNLIYQILLIIAGEKIFIDWTKNRDTIIDYVEELEEILVQKYGQKISIELMLVLKKLSVLMEIKVNPEFKEKIKKEKVNIEKELQKFEDKQGYIKKLTLKKNNLYNKIMEIDTTISDNKLLEQEYVKRNEKLPLEEKIFSMRVLAEIMIEEREELYKEMQEYNMLLKPKNFIARKEELEKKYEIIKLCDIDNDEMELNKQIEKLQKLFLECFKIKIKKVQNRHDLIKLMYQFRYYNLLPYNIDENVYEIQNIQKKLQEVGILLIRKGIELRTIGILARNEAINYELIKNMFIVRTINLEDLSIKIIKEKEDYYVQFFDDKAYDKKCELNFENFDKRQLRVRLNKKIKLFE